ncbi:MAG: excinuclease ABC subunit UvrC [Clostridia bacterium]|nr:excinuclease ABC subunit UvrC [Clostridia bacterium]
MTEAELKEKALSLPMLPGVYFYRDAQGSIIYIGKAKILKNRVSQYFHSNRPPKTELMIRHAASLEYVVTSDEFEALVLECTLIKQYKPRYNILLKDDKGYPFIRVDTKALYPRFSVVNKKAADGAEYFGPYGGRGVAFGVIEAVSSALTLPLCSRKFPEEIGKGRPCLHYQTGRCYGPCREGESALKYRELISKALYILDNKYTELTRELKAEMEQAAEELNFEKAATLRDRYLAVCALGEKQKVFTDLKGDVDAFGWHCGPVRSSFSVISLHKGVICRTRTESFKLSEKEFKEAIGEYIHRFYTADTDLIPDKILLTSEITDYELTQRLFSQLRGKKCELVFPKRGVPRQLLSMAEENAKREVERTTEKTEILSRSVEELTKLCASDTPLKTIEAFDISNTAGSECVASMVRFVNGAPNKNAYRKFNIKAFTGQDDYRAMTEAVSRRYSADDAELPDLILADGGAVHANTVRQALAKLGKTAFILGMVKDDRHRTRALVTPDGDEISLSASPPAFALVTNIQDEAHRFAITFHRKKRSKKLISSELDNIPGVGKTRKSALLKAFGSVKAIKNAGLEELEKAVPKDCALNVYNKFHQE